jgi:hypothetical protein
MSVGITARLMERFGSTTVGTIAAERTKVLTSLGQHQLQALTGGFHLAWAIGAGAVAVGALITFQWLRPRPRPDEVIAQRDEQGAIELQLEAA